MSLQIINSYLCSTNASDACAILPCLPKEKKEKETHVLCIYFKGRSQPKQAHPVSTCPEYKWHFLHKVDHLIMSAKYLKNIFSNTSR